MRIKQLELLGFKSFKEKTALTFPAGITAIVGPNGCGKSNVVDALRWVLGEQSPRHLRGQEMSDVVFAGNDHYAPVGMAEVTLVLENNAAELSADEPQSPLGNWSEVMVSRRYFRSGESEYLFNKVPCRLRDIVEFFLGTGAGTKAYSIIEQGRVDHLINAKPEDVRVLLDEAAGVSLYRSRRLAAERKLERTQENLSRVADLLHEMERQLGSLRRQAKKAEQYKALQEEFRTVDLTLLCHDYRRLAEESAGLEAQQEDCRRQEEQLAQDERRLLAERTQSAAILAQEEAGLHSLEERLRTLEATLRQDEQEKQFLSQQAQQAVARLATTEEEITGLREKQEQAQGEQDELTERAAETQQLLLADEVSLSAAEQEGGELQNVVRQYEGRVEEIKTEIVDLLTQEAQVQNALTYARRRAAEIEQRLHGLNHERERVMQSRAEVEMTLVAVQTRAAHLHDRVLTGQRQRAEKSEGLRAVVSTAGELDGELATAWAKQAEVRARLTTLEEMEQGYERYAQGVRSIMASQETPSGICGVFAHMVEVPKEYERAVAAVLRDRLEYVVVDGIEDGLSAVEYLRSAQAGHGSFIPLQPRATNGVSDEHPHGNGNGHHVEGIAPLLEILTVDERYRAVAETLLGDAVLVPDLRAGLQLWHQNGSHKTFVTPDGEVLTPHGVISGGSEGFAEEVFLERRREIRALRDEVERCEAVVAALVQRRQDMKHKQQELEGEILLLEAEARTLGQEREALQREEAKFDGDRRRLLDKQESIAYEQRTLQSESHSLAQEVNGHESREAALRLQRQEREAVLAAAQAEVAQAKVALERQRTAADDLRVRVAERRERQEGLRSQLARVVERRKELADRIAACQTMIAGANAEIGRLQANLTDLTERITRSTAAQASVAGECTAQQERCAQQRAHCRATEDQLEEVRIGHVRLQETKTRVEVSMAEKRVARAHVTATVRERYTVTIEDVLTQYGDSNYQGQLGEARRQELREKIARLGEVNPGAAAELAAEEERHSGLQKQQHDLRHSLDDLRSTIAKLNAESRDRFRTTFAQVNEKFGEVYDRLVDGGKAQLTMTDESNLAETGVEIAVQPPGKRLRSLQLLSGGEKALAALSLTFALFLIRPSPFCVLDEVDAPLDDANVGRFDQLLRELSVTTQILLITHNKRTMQAADTLYGVTMQEPGVSTIVSVRMS